ncbi:MAG: hypothetical protein U9R75_10145, partial [Candidatus Thermoplasmatota archaeon]|nr:hypothetical protein [Candidatus Thermoplasmatota archaeon]
MKGTAPLVITALLLITLCQPLAGQGVEGAGNSLTDEAMIDRSSSRDGTIEWTAVANISGSSFLNSTNDLLIGFDDVNTSFNIEKSGFDPYFDHNKTIRDAIDEAPGWLNDTLSWKFHEIWDMYGHIFADLLTNRSIDARYKDEIAFSIAYLPEQVLNRYYVFPQVLLDNVRMIYEVADEVQYANVMDTVGSDGSHSTIIYNVPNGTVTLPEHIYYWYIVLPRGSFENPYYINTTSELQTEPDQGEFWREYLYNNSDPGFPDLKDHLKNQTTLWNLTTNNPMVNGAIGGVTTWMMDSMVFGMPQKRSDQPIVAYQQHVGMCGEHSYLLTAVGKIALIPSVTVISFEMMHAWNMFYDRGWHVWRAYDGVIDDTYAEGAPGGVSVHAAFNPDSSEFSAASVHTQISNVTINVRDANGKPVDGAMVKLDSQPSINDPSIYGIIANHTDPEGKAAFEVGHGFAYHVQVISPIGQFLPKDIPLPVAVPGAVAGTNYTFNVTLNTTMPLKANLSKRVDDRGFGIRFNVTVHSLLQVTKAFRDPLRQGMSIRRGYPDRARIWVYFLDDENLSLYMDGMEFFPGGVLNLSSVEEISIILPDD